MFIFFKKILFRLLSDSTFIEFAIELILKQSGLTQHEKKDFINESRIWVESIQDRPDPGSEKLSILKNRINEAFPQIKKGIYTDTVAQLIVFLLKGK